MATLPTLVPPPRGAIRIPDPLQASRTLVRAMRSPACYSHRAGNLAVLETHISWVVLAGDFAYKVKKPVKLPFLDFSTLEARRHFCEEELRVNRRAAPGLYLDVVPITGVPEAPFINGPGAAIEYAVRMRRFDGADLLDRRAHDGRLGPDDIDALAASVAMFHETAPVTPANSPYGSPALVLEQALDNLMALESLEAPEEVGERLARLHQWTREEHARRAPRMEARLRDGFVRECHGDLHLGNVVVLEGIPRPFDAIEFDPRMREIDVASDLAFLLMDLGRHGLPRLSARLFDRYMQRTGDFGALEVLRFYLVYRALVRAKIASLRAHQSGAAPDHRDLLAHLDLAERLTHRRSPMLVLMHGFSGSGKTAVSGHLQEALSGVRLRSDVERRRIHGEALLGTTDSPLGAGLYDEAATDATYGRLLALAHAALPEGWPVLVDATFLERSRRERFREMARSMGARFAIVTCEAPLDVLRDRLRERAGDASEADGAVLLRQRTMAEPLSDAERGEAIVVGTRPGAAKEAARALLRRL